MRVAIVFIAESKREKLLAVAKGLAKGLESQGHQVDIVDGNRDVNTKLTIYNYIAIGTEAVSIIGGKIPEKVAAYLANGGMISGKRSFAFVAKSLLGATRALLRLMKAMEGEGMLVKYSQILQTELEAEEIGKRLHVK
jgi:menaquinone-dependent protoporphyrinogen IX oxidase